jgi:hypothetical protein
MADKTKSIKTATDKELDELLVRLRKENELQNLIGDLKRKSSPDGSYIPYDRPQVSTEEPIESLYHFGILGMKWGVRRNHGGVSKAGRQKAGSKEDDRSEDSKKKSELKKKKLRQMSNVELKSLNERLQLEKQYKELTKNEISAGRKFVTEVLAGAAKQTATTYASKYMGKGVEALLKKATSN